MNFTSHNPDDNHVAYVSLGMARGHLMMAAVVRSLLLSQGYRMSIHTTSLDGKGFLEAITDTSADLLGDAFRFVYDHWHNLYLRKSVLQVARYALSRQIVHDMVHVREVAADAAVIINDIHPVPILVQRSRSIPLVNVLSEHSLASVEQIFAGWIPGPVGRLGKATIRRIFTNCTHVIINTLEPNSFFYNQGNITFLPPIVQPVTKSTTQVREELDISSERSFFVAYLNPLFRRREILTQLIDLATHHNAFLYVVSESLVNFEESIELNHVRMVPYDFAFGEKIYAADLLITGAGLAAPIQAYAYGVPLVVLVSRHPEHQRNAATITNGGMGVAIKDITGLLAASAQALELRPRSHIEIVERTRSAWISIIDQAKRRR